MKRKRIVFTTMLLLTLYMISITVGSKVMAASDDEVITKGVYIDSINIGGMTVAEAEQAVQNYVDDLRSKKITVSVDEQSESITLGELDYNVVENNYLEEALNIGKVGNLIKRYKELKDIEETSLVYNLEFELNDEKINAFINKKLSPFEVPAVNASIARKNGEFVYTDHKAGRKVDVSQTLDTIKKSVLEGWNQQDLTVSAIVVDDIPLYTKETLEKCNTLLGTYSTTYTTSSADRAGNLANGARLINNTVLYPGDVFSAHDKLVPFTIDNGYYVAGAYANGKVIDSIGGGACQVTTTLYNAVLNAELEVVERSSHSMTISYVDLSRDAAIAGDWKDLKFKNNQEVPILIEAYTYGRKITFNIWGYETRDTENRKIKFETVILSEKQPGPDKITKDPTQPPTYELTTQSAHIGYVAELYKVVYENGVEVSRTRVNKSVYNATPREVTVGTKKEEKPVKPEKPVEETPATEEPVEEIPIEEIQNDNNTESQTPKDENSVEEIPQEENLEDGQPSQSNQN
jgi:vancomycin resistance protein YoaR